MAAWEYKIERLVALGDDAATTMKTLNSLGNKAWEAVAWLPNPNRLEEGWVLLKKPVRK